MDLNSFSSDKRHANKLRVSYIVRDVSSTLLWSKLQGYFQHLCQALRFSTWRKIFQTLLLLNFIRHTKVLNCKVYKYYIWNLSV